MPFGLGARSMTSTPSAVAVAEALSDPERWAVTRAGVGSKALVAAR